MTVRKVHVLEPEPDFVCHVRNQEPYRLAVWADVDCEVFGVETVFVGYVPTLTPTASLWFGDPPRELTPILRIEPRPEVRLLRRIARLTSPEAVSRSVAAFNKRHGTDWTAA